MNTPLAAYPAAGRALSYGGRLAASLLAAALSLWVARRVYLSQPVTTDENSYVFQAHTFSELRLRRPVPVPYELYWQKMVIMDEQALWVTRYPPGHPLWLTLGVWLGDVRLAVALAAGLSVWLLTGCARMLGAPAWPTAIFLLISPYFLFMHGTLLSHTSGMTAVAAMLWGYLRWRLRDRLDGAALAGLAWSLLFLNRTFTALLVAIPFALDALLALRRDPTRRQWRGAILFAGCAALGVLAYLGYNRVITGSAFQPTYLYYGRDEGLGFNDTWLGQHTVGRALENLLGNTRLLDRWLLMGGGALGLFALLVALGWTRRWSRLALLGILAVPLGHLYFFHPGVNICGPFYWFEMLPFFALAWTLAAGKLAGLRRPGLRRAAAAVGLAALAGMAVLSARFMRREAPGIPAQWTLAERAQLSRVLRAAPRRALVILQGFPWNITDWLVFNPRGPASDPLLFTDQGGRNAIITRTHPDRAAFFLKAWERTRLEPITAPLPFFQRTAWCDIRHRTGRATGPGDDPSAGREAGPGDRPDYLAMGYYITLPPGRFRAAFDLDIEAPDRASPCAILDVSAESGRRILARQEVGALPARTNVCLDFALEGYAEIEPRVLYRGGRVRFHGVTLTDAD